MGGEKNGQNAGFLRVLLLWSQTQTELLHVNDCCSLYFPLLLAAVLGVSKRGLALVTD